MTEAVKARDWLVDLQAAAEVDDSDGFQDLIVAIAKVRPDLKSEVCRVAGEYLEDGEAWAAGFFKKPLEEQRVNEPEPQPDVKVAPDVEVTSVGGWGKRRSLGAEPVTASEPQPKEARVQDEARPSAPEAATPTAKEAEPEPEIDEPEREVEPAPEAMFRQERAKPDDDVPILSKAAPFDSAREFARRHCFQQGFLATYFWREDFWQWNGCHYERMPATRINDQVYAFLDRARTGREDETVRFRPKPQDAEAVIKCLKAGLGLEGAPPRWLDADAGSGPKAENLLVFRNWLVDATTGKTYPLTPKLWVQDAVDFAYDPQARCPRWERFLKEIFPDDQVSQDCIEEQLGYGTTNETRFEKGALWIGVRRSGKSTVAFIQRKLAGEQAYAALSFSYWTQNENSHEHIVGRKVGIFADVRFKPAKMYGTSYDPGGIDHKSAELLLNITGRDAISIGQKYKGKWVGQSTMKVIITSNEVPNLQDASGVLPSRFIKLEFGQSFWGKEDIGLRDVLTTELPGIANRCLAAYRRLCKRGKFIQPASGLSLERKIEDCISPYAAFMHECVVKDDTSEGPTCTGFYAAFKQWCEDNGRIDVLRSTPSQKLITYINRLDEWEWLKSWKPHGSPRRYGGIKLIGKTGWPYGLEPLTDGPEPLRTSMNRLQNR